MKVRPLRESTIRYVRGSLRAYLEGSQSIAWITAVLAHSGLDFATTHDVFLTLEGYGDAERYRLMCQWFGQQNVFPLPSASEIVTVAKRSN